MGKRSAVVELFLGDMGSIQRELRPSILREDQLTMETKLEQIAVKAVNNRRAWCGKSSRHVVCPAKAGMFSRRQTCRGRSQSPVVWIAEVMETETLKPIDKTSLGEVTSHRAVTKVNALWPRK